MLNVYLIAQSIDKSMRMVILKLKRREIFAMKTSGREQKPVSFGINAYLSLYSKRIQTLNK